MSSKPIVIIGGEPKSIFLEIFLKSIKKIKKRAKPIILISSKDLLHKNMKKFHKKLSLNQLDNEFSNLKIDKINLVDIEFKNFSFSKRKITNKSNELMSIHFNVLKINKNKLLFKRSLHVTTSFSKQYVNI